MIVYSSTLYTSYIECSLCTRRQMTIAAAARALCRSENERMQKALATHGARATLRLRLCPLRRHDTTRHERRGDETRGDTNAAAAAAAAAKRLPHSAADCVPLGL